MKLFDLAVEGLHSDLEGVLEVEDAGEGRLVLRWPCPDDGADCGLYDVTVTAAAAEIATALVAAGYRGLSEGEAGLDAEGLGPYGPTEAVSWWSWSYDTDLEDTP